MAPVATVVAPLLLAALSVSASSHLQPRPLGGGGSHALVARKGDASFNQTWLQSNYKNGDAAPGAKSGDASGQVVVIDSEGGGDNNAQRAECPTVFIGPAAVNGSSDAGWQFLPQVVGFDLDRTLKVEGAVQPVYIENTKDAKLVKRVVIAQPGKPRDSWSYTNLFRNALVCAVSHEEWDISLADTLIVGPAWLSELEATAGAAQANDLYFSSGGWATGSQSRGPGDTSVSSFRVMDLLINKFFDKSAYPNVASVIVGGHSLGASMTQRYAFMRRSNEQDASIGYWSGNPGAYVWPSAERPVTPSDTSCSAAVDDWAYGVGGDLPAYRKSDTSATPASLYSNYFSHKYQYALGLEDDGPGDTHCEAQYQGSSHLERGQNMQKALQALPGGIPSSQSFNFVANTSHQDYLMISDVNSMNYLFVDGINDPRNASLDASSSSSGSGSSTKTKSSSSATGSGSSSSAPAAFGATHASAIFGLAAMAIVGLAL